MRWFDRAMFLDEHLGGGTTIAPDDDGLVDRGALLERWRTTCARGDAGRFAQRLAALGLDRASAADALRPRRFDVVPTWAGTAIEIGASAPALVAELDFADDAVVPFASLYLPWVRFGLEQLGRRVAVPAALHESLGAMLRSRLRFGETVLLDEHKRSGYGYEGWIEHQLHTSLTSLFETFPVWARLVTTVTLDWIDAIDDFLVALDDDQAIVAELAGEPVAVPIWVHQAGDPHNAGRQVLVVTTAAEHRVVYKPRSLAPEVAARAVSDRLRACGTIDVDLVAAVVDRGDHGWMGWVDTAMPSDEQMAKYSYNAGVTLALAHRLAIADLHFENVLPAGERPVLIDLECLGSTRPNLFTETAADLAREEILDRSVLSTCMLVAVGNYERDGRDESGLTGVLEAADADDDESYEWVGLGTDALDLVRRNVRARCDDTPVMVDVEQVLAGLDAGERTMDSCGVGVDETTDFEVRVIAQNSARYATLLHRLAQRSTLAHGLRCSIELDAVARPGTEAQASSWRLGACEAERRHLQRLDIPLFTVPLNSTAGRVGTYAILDLVDRSGIEAIEARRNDTGAAFRRLQLDVARLLLGQRLTPAGRIVPQLRSEVTESPADPLAVCAALAADLESRAVPDDHGGLAWLDIEQPGKFVRPVMVDAGLMSGNAGIGLFLAGLARLSRSRRWADLALATLAGEPPVDGPSLSYGASGRGYALVAAGCLLDDDELVRRGAQLFEALPPLQVRPSIDATDFLAGSAGIAAAAAAAATMTGDRRLAACATDHLDACHDAWQAAVASRDLRERTAATRIGVAHGITGIELAVARVLEARRVAGLADAPHHERWLADLLARENERVERRDGTPARLDPVTREPDVGWCWGASGFVAARRAIAGITDLDAAASGIERGVTLTAERAAPTDRACCGKSSQVFALTGTARQGVVDELLERRGRWTFEAGSPFQAVSLLRGSAGLGLALLEHAQPGAVPNPLIVEPATRS